jgi:rifampicin phosphotransferase
MNITYHTSPHIDPTIHGNKAYNLKQLANMAGVNIPPWCVIDKHTAASILNNDEAKNKLTTIIETTLEEGKYYAVRSSSCQEDGLTLSYAGLYSTYLGISRIDVADYVYKVALSYKNEQLYAYTTKDKNELIPAVIIQEMIFADKSGVAFSTHPTLGEKFPTINAMYGLGEGIVSGKYDADLYVVKPALIEKTIATKLKNLTLNKLNGKLQEIDVPDINQSANVLTDHEIAEVASLLQKCTTVFKKEQDIEFSYENGKLYLLQSRPITRHQNKETDYTIWDNSNIIESYPDVNTPLTFSFISKSYEIAYKNLCMFLGVDKELIKKNEQLYKNTLGMFKGRIYYNLKTWYTMLSLLPGFRLNAEFMEKMMGVKEKFAITNFNKISKSKSILQLVKSIFFLLIRYKNHQKEVVKFNALVDQTISTYKNIDYSDKSYNDVIKLFQNFETTLLNQWKAPLVNDLLAMVWYGVLSKNCQKYIGGEHPNIHNDLLSGSHDIISTQPLTEALKISTFINNNQIYKELFLNNEATEVYQILKTETQFDELLRSIKTYIDVYGERCVGELKLETKSYTQSPENFIEVLQSYLGENIKLTSFSTVYQAEKRKVAESMIKGKKLSLLKKSWLNLSIREARKFISGRENLRFQRSRAFGIVRILFNQAGKKLFEKNIIALCDDVYFLTQEELIAYSEGRSVNENLKNIISARKEEYSRNLLLSSMPERIITNFLPHHHYTVPTKYKKMDHDLKGVGCCSGIVRGVARVVANPLDAKDLNNEIMVARSTDPGWVILFPKAAAIVVERGSLLSHTAIVCREMGIPCIVAVENLLSKVRTGDELEIDGSTGEIKIINTHHESK